MSDQVRLVNQQLAFSQSHLQAARLAEGFMQRCQLQACKLQMYLLIHAYLAEIAERIALKWQLNLGVLNQALTEFEQQLNQQTKISSDFNHLNQLIHNHPPWCHWVDLSTSALFTGKNELSSPILNDPGTIIASTHSPAAPANPLNGNTGAQLELLNELLTALESLIRIQRQNKIEF
ncbi:MAG: hypothetical protein RL497_2932 [Pseudomonadota bacterium]|jgi:hypothetical protein